MWKMFALAMIGGLLASGCGGGPSQVPVVQVAEDDAAMVAAIEQARATLNQFTEALASPGEAQTHFSIKAEFQDGDKIEHMWLSPVGQDGANFVGEVNNEPSELTNVKFGDRVTVTPAEVSDWMFVEDGKLVGGYTIRALRDSVPAAERAELEKSFPFKFD